MLFLSAWCGDYGGALGWNGGTVWCTGAEHDYLNAAYMTARPAGAMSGCCAVGSAHPDPGSENVGRKHLRLNVDLKPWDPHTTHQYIADAERAQVHQRSFNHLCMRPGVRTCIKGIIGARLSFWLATARKKSWLFRIHPSQACTHYLCENM